MRNLISTTLFVLFSAMIFAGPNGRYVYHTVSKGETLYSISRQYGLKPADLALYNEGIAKKPIEVGQKIKIPTQDAVSYDATGTDAAPAASDQYHVVRKGETVFSISKEYNVSKSELLSWNKIRDNNIAVGQKLVIRNQADATAAPAEKPHTVPASSHPAEPGLTKNDVEKAMKDGYTWTMPNGETAKNHKTNVSTASGDITASSSAVGLADTKVVKSWKAESTTSLREYYKGKPDVYDPASEYESLYYQNVYSGMAKKTETGIAKFLADNNTANTAYYNNAPIGTILKLTNNENGKSTYAIVVGKVPPSEGTSYLMKLSGKVARNLAAKDYDSIEIVCYTEN